MKISYNWLNKYLSKTINTDLTSEVLTHIGLEVEGEEKIESIPGGLKGLVVGKVLTCDKHPNADKLSLTSVDIGIEEPLSIVCGAPNVAAGQSVIVATVGTVLYPIDGDSFKIKKGKIRGEVSMGMICAEDEIGLGHSHDGIMVLDKDFPAGTPAREVFELNEDVVFDIGLTPNRSDATCHMGVAQDFVAAMKVQHQSDVQFIKPTINPIVKSAENALAIDVQVLDAEACPRYAGVCINNIKVGPSPDWLRNALQAVGVRSINNLVDITNYVLHEFGQPLHAFDYEKIKGKAIKVQTLAEGSTFLSLDEKERTLKATDLMICDANDKGMCIGGVFGGLDSGVTEQTTSIFLESAHFSPISVRNTSTHHNLRTDAAKVFEKGSDPSICVDALNRAVDLIVELCGATVASDVIDIYPEEVKPKQIAINYNRVNSLIGANLSIENIHHILTSMGMELSNETEHSVTVAVPTNKFDVLREVDVIEEILRIYGYNNIVFEERINAALSYYTGVDKNQFRNMVADLLAANGCKEMMGLSLVRSTFLEKLNLGYEENSLVYINNTSTPDLDVMRPNMLINTLETVLYNQNRQSSDIRLFEFGKEYAKDGEKNSEVEKLTITISGSNTPESWLATGRNVTNFHSLKSLVHTVLTKVGIQQYQENTVEDKYFEIGLQYTKGPKEIVTFGKVQTDVITAAGIKEEVYFASFDVDNLIKMSTKGKSKYDPISVYPVVRRDLAFVLNQEVKFAEIKKIISNTDKKRIKDVNLFDVYENEEQLGVNKKSYAISIKLEDKTKTLVDKEVDNIINKVIKSVQHKLDVQIRK